MRLVVRRAGGSAEVRAVRSNYLCKLGEADVPPVTEASLIRRFAKVGDVLIVRPGDPHFEHLMRTAPDSTVVLEAVSGSSERIATAIVEAIQAHSTKCTNKDKLQRAIARKLEGQRPQLTLLGQAIAEQAEKAAHKKAREIKKSGIQITTLPTMILRKVAEYLRIP